MNEKEDRQRGLYRPEYEHDACGVGLVASLDNTASRTVVESGLTILKRLTHRGATGNDPRTGDGAGILLRIPDAFFRRICVNLPKAGHYGIAMVFGGEGEEAAIESIIHEEGCKAICWRDVPIEPSAIGDDARAVMPRIRQLFIAEEDSTSATGNGQFERRLYVIRRLIEKAARSAYICSCSSRTIVYKGLLLAAQMERFYKDLTDPDFMSPFALVHQRYSTNTFPSWELAHPFRALAHNGEINALKGNLNALSSREASLASPVFGDDIKGICQRSVRFFLSCNRRKG